MSALEQSTFFSIDLITAFCFVLFQVGDELLSGIKCLGVVPYGLVRDAETLCVHEDHEEKYNSVK